MDENAIDWKRFKFMVFDLPTHRGTYEERYAALGKTDTLILYFFRIPLISFFAAKKFEGSTHPYIEVAPMQICTSMDHLEKTFQDILDMGGEGVILRDPTSPYQEGRSAGYLKHKVSYFIHLPPPPNSFLTQFFLFPRNIETLKRGSFGAMQTNGNANCKCLFNYWNKFLFLVSCIFLI